MSAIKKFFRRKKNVPLACSINIENEPDHVHTAACFLDIQPLSVVELFHSQGCAACPPAIPGIQSAAVGPDLLLLTYNVTHFDYTGWTDTFGSRAWDNRQKAYVKKWGRNNVFTPQVIVDGLADGTGANGEVPSIVSSARQLRSSMGWHIILDTNETDLRIDSDRPLPSEDDLSASHMPSNNEVFDINLIFFESKQQTVKVGKGPNKGKKIVHGNIVKGVHKLGEWKGGNLILALPGQEQKISMGYGGLEAVAIVQGQNGGGIVAAQRL